MVTYNRSDIVKEYLDTAVDFYADNNIGLFIFDGSEDEKTHIVVQEKNCSNIHYFKCPEKSFTERSIDGFNVPDAEYVILTGDSRIPLCNNISKVFDLIQKEFDCIVATRRDKKQIGYKEYTDSLELFKDAAWDMTVTGSVFLKKNAYYSIDSEDFIEKYGYTEWPQMLLFFNYIKADKFSACYLDLPVYTETKQRKGYSWSIPLKTFGLNWINVINHLDPKYNKYKEQVIMDHGKFSSLKWDRVSGFSIMRCLDTFNYDIYVEYKDIIPKLTTLSLARIEKISRYPKVLCWLLIYLEKVKNKLKNIWF